MTNDRIFTVVAAWLLLAAIPAMLLLPAEHVHQRGWGNEPAVVHRHWTEQSVQHPSYAMSGASHDASAIYLESVVVPGKLLSFGVVLILVSTLVITLPTTVLWRTRAVKTGLLHGPPLLNIPPRAPPTLSPLAY